MHNIATKPDLETIMRRLKGESKDQTMKQAAPSLVLPIPNDSETTELKQIVKMLGTKLKTSLEEKQSLQDLLIKKETEMASTLAMCTEKDEIIETLQKKQDLLMTEKVPLIQEEEINQLRSVQNNWIAAQENFIHIEQEAEQLRKAQLEWQEEREHLLQELHDSRSAQNRLSQEQSSQILRMAMTCRELEDEIHALTCERAATLQRYREQREAFELLKESKEKCIDQIAEQESSLLEKDNQIKASQAQENCLQEEFLIKEERLQSVQKEYDQLKITLTSTTDEKNRLIQHVQEVEEVLVLKLTLISELQEQIVSLQALAESLQQNNASLTHSLHQTGEELQQIQKEQAVILDSHAKAQQQLQELERQNASLIERTQRYECLSNTVKEAKDQTMGLLKILESGKTPTICISKLVEELSIRPAEMSGILVEDRFEQHDLF